MRKGIFIAALLILGCAAVFFSFSGRSSSKPITISFLAYTNSGASEEAIFVLTNPPPAAINLYSVRRMGESSDNESVHEAGGFHRAARNSWGLTYTVGIKKTNEPLELVFGFQLRAVGARRVIEQVQEWFGRVTGGEREFFTGQTLFVTNHIPSGAAR